jgi:hypothetical protein
VQEDYRRAAMLLGVADRAHSQIHYVFAGPVRAQADAALAKVRAALGAEDFAEAFAAGQHQSHVVRLTRPEVWGCPPRFPT